MPCALSSWSFFLHKDGESGCCPVRARQRAYSAAHSVPRARLCLDRIRSASHVNYSYVMLSARTSRCLCRHIPMSTSDARGGSSRRFLGCPLVEKRKGRSRRIIAVHCRRVAARRGGTDSAQRNSCSAAAFWRQRRLPREISVRPATCGGCFKHGRYLSVGGFVTVRTGVRMGSGPLRLL